MPGEELCPATQSTVELIIEKTSEDDEVRCTFVGTGIAFVGKLSYDCAAINIEVQKVSGLNGKIQGALY